MVGMIRRVVITVSVLLSAVGALPPGAARAEPSSALDDLVDAAAQRLQTADAVAASKWLTGGPITDPARVQQVLAAVTADAQAAGSLRPHRARPMWLPDRVALLRRATYG